jgi:macrolide transport system ATP-binding/permease protein
MPGWTFAELCLQDFRFALRRLFQSKGFAITAALTLALGIGANTAIYTLVHAVMLKSLPVADPQRLIRLGDGDNCCVLGGFQGNFSVFAYPLYTYLRDHTPEFEEVAAFQAGLSKVGVRRTGASVPLVDQFVSGNFFSMLGLRPFAGRLLSPADDVRGAAPVAVMSYRAWEQVYGADPSVIGSTFIIDGAPFTIAGIAPPGFFGAMMRPDPPDFWMPIADEPAAHRENSLLDANLMARNDEHWLYIIGRAKTGVHVAPLEAKLNVELRQWFLENDPPRTEGARKELERQHITLVPGGAGVAEMKLNYEHDLRLLMGITLLVLLIACANLANLQLARGAADLPQISIRVALGAPRSRVMRQVLAEAVVLALAGGAAGLIVATQLASLLMRLAFPAARYVPIQATPSLPVLGFAFLLSLITGIVFGLAPAWSAARADPASALQGAGRTTHHTTLPQKSLMVLQAALSLVLLSTAGLMALTLRNLQNQQFGFPMEAAMVVNVNAGFGNYTHERLGLLYREIEQRMWQIPGVRNAALALYSPMSGNNWQSGVTLEERPGRMVSPSWDRVSPSFFETIGARILRGRVFDERDTVDSTHVAVANQEFAASFFPNEDPIGKRFGLGGVEESSDYQIIGVVSNIIFRNPREPVARPMFFLPLLQMSKDEWENSGKARSNFIQSIVLRVSGRPPALASQIQRALATIDPNLTMVNMMTMKEQLGGLLRHERLIARLAELFGLLALVLASVGLYGITAYSVARRTSEIGIRVALGASRSNVIQLILAGALAQTGIGLIIGIPAALGAGSVLAGQLYGVKASDPLILGGAVVMLAVCAIAAGLIPALRAAGIDPARTLRVKQ